jgi:HEXXH motif-containing protein
VNELDRACRGFSNPFEPFHDGFLDAVVVTHAREATRRFLDRFAAGTRRESDGLVPALERWLGAPATFEDVWDAAFGRLFAASRGDAPEDAVRRAAAAALRVAERGAAADWEARLDPAARMRVGASVLPAGERLRVRADGRRLEIRLRRGRRTWTWMLPQPVPFAARLDGAENLSAAHAGKDARVLILREGAPGLDTSLEEAAADGDPDSIVPPLDAALRLIGKYAPRYLRWIQRVVRQILPLRDRTGMTTSSTAEWRPGILYLANRPDPSALAEMLLHEGSHQYMYVLRRLGPLDDGSDPSLYYSPISGQMRPLATIVLAYHAVGNILLFCRDCPAKSGLRPRRIEKEYSEAIVAYERVLRGNRALTHFGAALWEPLSERLHDVAAAGVNAARPSRRARKDAPESYRSTPSRRTTPRRTSCRPSHRPGPAGRIPSTTPAVR